MRMISSHMLIAIKECQRFLDQKGLKVNAGKCGSLSVLPLKGKRSMKVITGEHRWWVELKDLNKYTAAGVDGILTQDLKKMPIGHIASIMNYWWG